MAFPHPQIVLEGHSLGSGVAAVMARLFLLAPYSSMVDAAQRALPIFPVRFLLRDRCDTLGKATGLTPAGHNDLFTARWVDCVAAFTDGERCATTGAAL